MSCAIGIEVCNLLRLVDVLARSELLKVSKFEFAPAGFARHGEELNGRRSYLVNFCPQIASICSLEKIRKIEEQTNCIFGFARTRNGVAAMRLVFPAFRGTLGVQCCSQPFEGLLAFNGVPSLPRDSWLLESYFTSCKERQSLLQLEDSIGQLPCDGSRITES